jgi:hypothetical protein
MDGDPANRVGANQRFHVPLGGHAMAAGSHHGEDVAVWHSRGVQLVQQDRHEQLGAGLAGAVVHQDTNLFSGADALLEGCGTHGLPQRALNRR